MLLSYVLLQSLLIHYIRADVDGRIHLKQGVLLGLQIYPETSRTAVHTFLGVPYAQPPTADLRFAPPRAHAGWGNRTYRARDFRPNCPQLHNYAYDEVHGSNANGNRPSGHDEDCLFLNVWTPHSALQSGNHSVLVIVTGEEQAFDWTQNRPNGLDLAGDGIVVVTIQSRMNVFGWLTLRTADAPGNLGLLDQRLALHWIRDNIQRFGGNPNRITVLGHGTSGAANAMIHLRNTKTVSLISGMILMSGSIFSTYSFRPSHKRANDPTVDIVKKLACHSAQPKHTLQCLRQKSVGDLLHAFDFIYQHGNYTHLLGPEIDTYLPADQQYVPRDPRADFDANTRPTIPLVIGICSNEGAFMQDLWLELARDGYDALSKYVSSTLIPNILAHLSINPNSKSVREMIQWRFFSEAPKTTVHLLNSIQRLISETRYESPFLQAVHWLSHGANQSADSAPAPSNLYTYTFHMPKSMDIRGAINFFGGASHTSDLLFLMGPSLFQQIGRRKLTQYELKLCKKMRQMFVDFVKSGNPTPERVFDAWKTYNGQTNYMQIMGDAKSIAIDADNSIFFTDAERNADEINGQINRKGDSTQIVSSAVNPYQIGASGYQDSESDANNNNRISKNYIGAYERTDYYNSLSKINAFWIELLPRFGRAGEYQLLEIGSRSNVMESDDDLYIAAIATGNGSKFKHAFISMLVLVCLLLAVLCICLYILKRTQRIDTSYL